MSTGPPFLVQASLCSYFCQDSNAPSFSNCLCCLLLQSWQVLLQPVGGCGATHTHFVSQLHDYGASVSASGISVQLLLSGSQCTKPLKLSLLLVASKLACHVAALLVAVQPEIWDPAPYLQYWLAAQSRHNIVKLLPRAFWQCAHSGKQHPACTKTWHVQVSACPLVLGMHSHTHLASQLLPGWADFHSRHTIVKALLRALRCTVLFARQLPKLVPKDGLCRLDSDILASNFGAVFFTTILIYCKNI